MLLSKLPALDKGFAALVSSTNDHAKLRELISNLTPASIDRQYDIASMTLLIKCPVFVQLNLSQFGLTIMHTTLQEGIEVYLPDETHVSAQDLETSKLISDDIKRTSEALTINPRSYRADGCDHFISQVITPISVYTTIAVHGTRRQWLDFLKQPPLPLPVEAYRIIIKQIYEAEWKDGKTKD